LSPQRLPSRCCSPREEGKNRNDYYRCQNRSTHGTEHQ
jgi:hypothetical protein